VARNNFATPKLHEPFKMTSVADPVLEQHKFGNQDPDPHQSEMLDPIRIH
jgi:hypothetical protein